MRIVHVISGLGNGGAEAILFNLCKETVRRHDITVVSLTDEGWYGPYLRGLGVRVVTLKLKPDIAGVFGALKLISILHSADPDLVQTWMYHADVLGGLAARVNRVEKLVWGVHSSADFLCFDKRVRSRVLMMFAVFTSYFLPDEIICCSEVAKVSHQRIGFNSRKMTVVANGVDTNYFRPNRKAGRVIRNNLGISRKKFLIGMAARWDPIKNHHLLFRALARLNLKGVDYGCVLVGASMTVTNASLAQAIRGFGLEENVSCLGPLAEMQDFYNALDLHVLTSEVESFGNVTAEAMACGVPCLMTNTGMASEFLASFSGVVNKGDAEGLAEKILDHYRRFQERPASSGLTTDARTHIVKHFSIDAMTRRYERLWTERSR